MVLPHRGIPTEANALAFVVGPVAAFALVGMVANRGLRRVSPPQPRSFSLWPALHLLSGAVAIGGAAVITRIVQLWIAWPASGFTTTQLSVGASAHEP